MLFKLLGRLLLHQLWSYTYTTVYIICIKYIVEGSGCGAHLHRVHSDDIKWTFPPLSSSSFFLAYAAAAMLNFISVCTTIRIYTLYIVQRKSIYIHMYRFLPSSSSSSPLSLTALPFSQLEKLLNMYIHTTVMGNTTELNFQGIAAAAAVPLHRWNNNKKKLLLDDRENARDVQTGAHMMDVRSIPLEGILQYYMQIYSWTEGGSRILFLCKQFQ